MNNITISQDLQLYKIKNEAVFPIRSTDWFRLKKLIDNFTPEKRIYQVLYSVACGIFVTSTFSLITLFCTTNVPTWALITIWSTTITSLIIGLALIFLDLQYKRTNISSKEIIIEEIERIEELFDYGSR